VNYGFSFFAVFVVAVEHWLPTRYVISFLHIYDE
jgi:hypothetical protein